MDVDGSRSTSVLTENCELKSSRLLRPVCSDVPSNLVYLVCCDGSPNLVSCSIRKLGSNNPLSRVGKVPVDGGHDTSCGVRVVGVDDFKLNLHYICSFALGNAADGWQGDDVPGEQTLRSVSPLPNPNLVLKGFD